MAILESCWRSRLLLSLGFPAVGLWPPVSLCVSPARPSSLSYHAPSTSRGCGSLQSFSLLPKEGAPSQQKKASALTEIITSFWRQIGRYQQKSFTCTQGTWLSSLICPSPTLPLGAPFHKEVELPLFSQSSSWPPQTRSALPSRLILLAHTLAFYQSVQMLTTEYKFRVHRPCLFCRGLYFPVCWCQGQRRLWMNKWTLALFWLDFMPNQGIKFSTQLDASWALCFYWWGFQNIVETNSQVSLWI